MCQSLIQKVVAPGAKVYGMGKDGAREATFKGKSNYPSEKECWDGDWIFQCKFHDTVQLGPKEARKQILLDLDDEISKIIEYDHPCDNYILITNVTLTPVFQKGTKDKIDKEIIPKYKHVIKHIHVWGSDEICRFLDAFGDIRQTYSDFLVSGDIISRLLEIVDQNYTDLDEIVKLYCYGCFNHEQYAHLDDAEDVEDERIELQRVFVDLDVESPPLPHETKLLEQLPNWLKQASEDETRTSALSYLLDDSILGLVILGGSGEGKSTLGQYLAQIYRARLIGKLNEVCGEIEEFEKCTPRIPFRILLKDYAQWSSSSENSGNLFDYLTKLISEKVGRTIDKDVIHSIIKSNPIILILDGLDEVPRKELRLNVLDNINSFVDQIVNVFNCDLRVIATTRPYGYSEEFNPFHYLHLSLNGLSSEKAEDYAKLWTKARQPDPENAKEILETFKVCLKDRVVSVLTKTPLQVTILLFIINSRGTPPKQKEELFDKYMDIIYLREQKKRSELVKTEKDIIYGLHKYLAFILHRRAEIDATAALMDVSEFRRKVKEYLEYTDPSLNSQEIECTANQIITEVNERLVLIESPQEGKVGFSLTTIREFFAASYLVDTSETSSKRDSRFKTISKSPHWRNVALFFTGRVGRILPGEAPSIINVCQEIDSEGVDIYLKRGAELVMDILDDRALREPRDVLAATRYGITLLDNVLIQPFKLTDLPYSYLETYDSLIEKMENQLNNFPDKQKDRFVRSLIEEKIETTVPENLGLYINIYETLFGCTQVLKEVLQRLAELDSNNIKLWAISKALENNILEFWVIEQLEELIYLVPLKELAYSLNSHALKFQGYLEFSMSPELRDLIITTNLIYLRRFLNYYTNPKKLELENFFDKLENVEPYGEIKKNSLLFWAISQLSKLLVLNSKRKRYLKKYGYLTNWNFPIIANPKVKETLSKNEDIIQDFCKTFSKEGGASTNLILTIFEFLLDPCNIDNFRNLSKELEEHEDEFVGYDRVISLLGLKFRGINLEEYHNELCNIYRYYESEEAYLNEMKELSKIITQDSEKITNHPYKLLSWIKSNNDHLIEEFLDKTILTKLRRWLEDRHLSKDIVNVSTLPLVFDDKELCKFSLELAHKQILSGQKNIYIDRSISSYKWEDLKCPEDLAMSNQLKNLFETILEKYPSLNDSNYNCIKILYGAALNANIVEEKHMIKLYEIMSKEPDLAFFSVHLSITKNTYYNLFRMLKSDQKQVFNLSAVTLAILLPNSFYLNELSNDERSLMSKTLWELAKDKENVWHEIYLLSLSENELNWAEKHLEIFEGIKNADEGELRSWCRILVRSNYCGHDDRESLLRLLLDILESEDVFPELIRLGAIIRLKSIVSENEPVLFGENTLDVL